MTDEKHNDNQSLFDRLIAVLSGLPWLDVLGEVWKIVRKVIQGRSYRGMYEVLEYESTLEVKDRGGKRATFKKREKVRYLQDNVIAYQDQAWGDGEILVNYRNCFGWSKPLSSSLCVIIVNSQDGPILSTRIALESATCGK